MLPAVERGVLLVPSQRATIWLPQKSPSMPAAVPIASLMDSLQELLFQRVPDIVHADVQHVKWHFNPLCQACSFRADCKSAAVKAGRLGTIPNLSISDATALEAFLPPHSVEIEELDKLLSHHRRMHAIEVANPALAERIRKIFGPPLKTEAGKQINASSAVIRAARSGKAHVS